MTDKKKKWLISCVNTFLSGFVLAMLPVVDTLTLVDFRNGVVVGLLFVGVRAGIKAIMEAYLKWLDRKKKSDKM